MVFFYDSPSRLTHICFQHAPYPHPACSVSSQHADSLRTVPPTNLVHSYLGHLPKMFSHLLAPKLSLTSHTTFQNCSGLHWSFAFSALLQVCNILALYYTYCPAFSLIVSYAEKLGLPLRIEASLSPEFVPCTWLPHRTQREIGHRINTGFAD